MSSTLTIQPIQKHCEKDKKGEKLWDLKTRQPSALLDKEGIYLQDPYDDDEDVIKNELKDDSFENENQDANAEDAYDDDEDEEDDEKDDIEEELLLYEEDSDEDDEDSYDDNDSEIKYRKK